MNHSLSPGTSDLFKVETSGLPVFGDLINDFNPLHRKKEVAKSLGFQDTPVFAVWLEAKAEEYVRTHNLTEGLGIQPLIYAGHSFKFREAVYPEQYITFSRSERKITHSGVEVKISASNDSKEQVLDSIAFFGNAFPEFEEPSGELIYNMLSELSYDDHLAFHNLIEQPGRRDISYVHVASNIPAALLEKAYHRTNQEKPALSRSVELKFHGSPQFGEVRTEIYLSKAKNLNTKEWLYNVGGVCYQGEQAILSGKMSVIYPDKLT